MHGGTHRVGLPRTPIGSCRSCRVAAGAGQLQVRLLGPMDVVVDGVPRPVTGLRRKAVLAVLALQPGQIVAADRLLDAVWGDDAPSTAANTLQSHVSHLRRLFGSKTAILARP